MSTWTDQNKGDSLSWAEDMRTWAEETFTWAQTATAVYTNVQKS